MAKQACVGVVQSLKNDPSAFSTSTVVRWFMPHSVGPFFSPGIPFSPICSRDVLNLLPAEIDIDRFPWDRYKSAQYKGFYKVPFGKGNNGVSHRPLIVRNNGQWRPPVPAGLEDVLFCSRSSGLIMRVRGTE
jgi:hypothetical protein